MATGNVVVVVGVVCVLVVCVLVVVLVVCVVVVGVMVAFEVVVTVIVVSVVVVAVPPKTASSWMSMPLFNPAASKQGHHKSYCLDPVEVVTVVNTPSHPE